MDLKDIRTNIDEIDDHQERYGLQDWISGTVEKLKR